MSSEGPELLRIWLRQRLTHPFAREVTDGELDFVTTRLEWGFRGLPFFLLRFRLCASSRMHGARPADVTRSRQLSLRLLPCRRGRLASRFGIPAACDLCLPVRASPASLGWHRKFAHSYAGAPDEPVGCADFLCVWAYAAYRMHVIARHAGAPMPQVVFQHTREAIRSVAARSCRGRDAIFGVRHPPLCVMCLALMLRRVRSGRGLLSFPRGRQHSS